jgi:uncharacterized protein YidB (DUF937 family)
MDTPATPETTVPLTQHPALYDELGALVAQSGGVSGLVQQFEQKGLGGVIAGWISSGPNPPIGGDQIIDVLGHDRVMDIAGKLGLSEEQVANGISTMLPKLIDGMTPNGTVPDHTPSSYATAFNMLKTQLFGS